MSIFGLISRKTLTCRSETHEGQLSWSWLEHTTCEEKLGEWVCSTIREGSGETLSLLITDWKIEDGARLFLNAHGDRARSNEQMLEQGEIYILGGCQLDTALGNVI